METDIDSDEEDEYKNDEDDDDEEEDEDDDDEEEDEDYEELKKYDYKFRTTTIEFCNLVGTTGHIECLRDAHEAAIFWKDNGLNIYSSKSQHH
jgi:hypothetical protein